MAAAKPTVILVHGAYHTSNCYDIIKSKLEALSYPVIAVDLVTMNAKSPSVSLKDDVAEIHRIMLPLLDAGKEVTVVGHSYGGIPAYLSTEGQSIAERTQDGKKGGVRSVVFLCAFAVSEVGKSCTDTNTPSDVTFIQFREDGLLDCNEWAKTVFYEDLPEEERESWFKKLGTMSPGAFLTPVDFSAPQLKVPSLYLITEKDRAVMLELQERMVAAIPGIKTIRLPCGHSPFLSHPDETVDAIVKGAALR